MNTRRFLVPAACSALAAAALALLAGSAPNPDVPTPTPLIIAHRGASAYLPEHTLAAYTLAYGMGADVIEPDVVLTRDGELICSHDLTLDPHLTPTLERTFASRRRPDGKWYFIDFDLAELKGMQTALGCNAAALDGFQIASFDEMVTTVQHLNAATGRNVAIIPEAKSPAFHRSEGKPIEPALVDALARHGYRSRTDAAIIQCFDLESLRQMRKELHCDLRLMYLISDPVTPALLDDLATFADGVGPSRKLIEEDDGAPGKQPDLVTLAHARRLAVYPYTFDADAARTKRFFSEYHVDGLFTNNPDVGVRVRDK